MAGFSLSWTRLCNRALGRMGAGEISDLSEGTQNAGYCNTYLGEAVDEVLAQYDWKCCRKRVRLAPDTVKPAFGWTYRFPLPTGFIRLVRILPGREYREADKPVYLPYEIENGCILADEDTLELVYIERPNDPNTLTPGVRHAVTLTLAALLAPALTSSEQLIVLLGGEKTLALERAKVEDAQMNYDPLREGDPWSEEARG
jgi:hypothetical protein